MINKKGQVLLEVLWCAVLFGLMVGLFNFFQGQLESGKEIFQGFSRDREILIRKD